MRLVVFGAGAVGGVVGARLHEAGHEVALVARGAHLEAIRRDGLRLRTPVQRETFRIAAAADPAELELDRADAVLLAVKSQDTIAALAALRDAGAGPELPIVCLQNGVENERAALRLFRSVYGAVVLAPSNHLEPGVVEAQGAKLSGILDVGRYPAGSDALAERVTAAFAGARFVARVVDDVMRLKHAKLLLNLGNVVGALFADPPERRSALIGAATAEGRAALDAAGIAHDDADVSDRDARWRQLGVADIDGRPRGGSSTWQSLANRDRAHPPSLETDYLNGEVCLIGRAHGVPTPINDALCRLAAQVAREGRGPGELSIDDDLPGVIA